MVVQATHRPLVIEAGHAYATEDAYSATLRSVHGMYLGWLIAEAARVRGCDPTVLTMTDDFGSRRRACLPGADLEWFESDFTVDATALVRRLQEKVAAGDSPWRLAHNNKVLYLGVGKKHGIRLVRTGEYSGLPSCEVFDLAMYCAKLQMSPVTITVLPESFAEQQQRVFELYALLTGEPPPVVVVYHNVVGQVTSVFHANPAATNRFLFVDDVVRDLPRYPAWPRDEALFDFALEPASAAPSSPAMSF